MESYLQKLAKKRGTAKEPTPLPILNASKEHGATCDCDEAGCGDDGGCCSG